MEIALRFSIFSFSEIAFRVPFMLYRYRPPSFCLLLAPNIHLQRISDCEKACKVYLSRVAILEQDLMADSTLKINFRIRFVFESRSYGQITSAIRSSKVAEQVRLLLLR